MACRPAPPRATHGPEPALTYFYLGVFAILGAFARYGQSELVPLVLGHAFPFATLSINVIGSLLMGLLFTFTLERGNISSEVRTGMLTGGLGAYTTFSTFSLESRGLLQHGHVLLGAAYMVGSALLCVLGALLGTWMARRRGAR